MTWDEIKKLIEGSGGNEVEEEEVEEEESKKKSPEAIVKENALTDRIKKLMEEMGIDTSALREDIKDIDDIISMAKKHHKLGVDERQKERDKVKAAEGDPWEEFAKRIADNGRETEEADEEAEGKPKTFSMTVIAIGKPKKKFMESADGLSKASKFKSASELEDGEEDKE